MRGILPESVRTRTEKTVFGNTVVSEFESQWPLYEQAFGPGSRSKIAERGYVDGPRFWERLNDVRQGVEATDLIYVLEMVGLETWLRTLELPRAEAVTVPPATTTAVDPSEGFTAPTLIDDLGAVHAGRPSRIYSIQKGGDQ
jgi:asparagine synthase (glutamine-hydrolysing)